MTFLKGLGAAVLISLLGLGPAAADEISGAGSTFVFPILSKWAADYAAKTDTIVKYQSIGSGAGIAQIKAGSVDFGATDAPLRPEELKKLGLAQFPLVIGGIVPIVNIAGVNIPGVKPGELRFTGQVLADIYLGRIKAWNDPALAGLNPDVRLPAAPIIVSYRSDSSGTTFNWTNYLSKVSADWRAKVGEGTAVSWLVGAGSKGNEGVAAFVAQTANSIGYVEYAYVLQNKLNYGLVQNKAGKYLKPDASSFQAAAAGADWSKMQDFYLVMTDSPAEAAYPIAATAFVLMHKAPRDATRSKTALKFFRWALENGQKQAAELDYVALPPSLVEQIDTYMKSVFAATQ